MGIFISSTVETAANNSFPGLDWIRSLIFIAMAPAPLNVQPSSKPPKSSHQIPEKWIRQKRCWKHTKRLGWPRDVADSFPWTACRVCGGVGHHCVPTEATDSQTRTLA